MSEQNDDFPKIILRPKREVAVKRFHPWVFSGAIKKIEGTPEDGNVVEVYSSTGKYLATGHYHKGSIMVRIFSFQATQSNPGFWQNKLAQAYALRKRLGLTENPSTDCFRLVHGEGDGLPGLVIDLYGETAVVQCHSIGMHREREKLAEGLKAVFGNRLKSIYDKSEESLPATYAATVQNQYLFGEFSDKPVLENGQKFQVNWETGQKTGFFLDQRVNRQTLTHYCRGKSVLNTFCYSGGFSIYALAAGANLVHSVDISQKAIELTQENVQLNEFQNAPHEAFTADVFKFLKSSDQTYDIVVVDPPAYAKSLKKRHNAVQGYKRLNAAAFQRVAPGGLMFTFSCSQVVDKTLFYNTIVAAAIEARRQVKVIAHLSQPGDHPVSLFHPEGAYLKGLILYVAD